MQFEIKNIRNDEIGELYNSFKDMAFRLSNSFREIEDQLRKIEEISSERKILLEELGQKNFDLFHLNEDLNKKMKKLHIAISTNKIEETVSDYSARLGVQPCSFIPNEYALWRTDSLNLSIRQDSNCRTGELRHLGWEDAAASEFSQETDVNGIVWERFSAQQQADEINELWPEAKYRPEK